MTEREELQLRIEILECFRAVEKKIKSHKADSFKIDGKVFYRHSIPTYQSDFKIKQVKLTACKDLLAKRD